MAVGPLVGGAITSGIGWRWIFFVNVPIGVVAVVITLTKVAESKDPRDRRIDWVGFVTFSVSLFLLVFALVRGNDVGWGSPTSSACWSARGGADGRLPRRRVAHSATRCSTSACSSARPWSGSRSSPSRLSASIFAMFLYLTLYIQDDLGYGPLAAGVRFLPAHRARLHRGPLRRQAHRAGPVALPARASGCSLVAGGLLLMATTHADSAWTVLLPGFIVCGLGIGTVNPVLASAAISVVPPQRSGMASGANNTFRQVGIATGIAGLGAVFQSQIVAHTSAALRQDDLRPRGAAAGRRAAPRRPRGR